MKDNRLQIIYSSRSVWACIMASFLLALPFTGYSQTQEPSSNQNKKADSSVICVLRFAVYLAVVEVEIKDQYGQDVSNLKRKDFIVYDNGKKQKIEHFVEEKKSEPEGISTKYEIGYLLPEDLQDGEFRDIRVRVRNAKRLGISVLYNPIGYYAPPKR